MSHPYNQAKLQGKPGDSFFIKFKNLSGFKILNLLDLGYKVYQDGSVGEDLKIPKNIRMDSSGRLVDEKGNVIELNENKVLKINKKAQKKNNIRPLRSIQRKAQIDQIKFKQSEFFDADLEVDKTKKRNRMKMMGLHFAEQGSHIKKAEVLRKKEISKQLGIDEEQKEEKVPEVLPVEEDLKSRLLRKIGQLKTLDPIPDVEWWDAYLLPEDKSNFSASNSTRVDIESLSRPLNIEEFKVNEDQFNTKKITHYVQHPIPLKNQDFEKIKSMTVPIMLTDKERKRLKKLKKAERVKERHEKISLGLMPAPEPRLKMSSFMRAVTAQAVADPSKVEKDNNINTWMMIITI